MARTFSQTIVSSKMDILVEHRDYLQTFVDETNKVLQLTTSWLSNDDTSKNFTSSEINKMIDDKLAFLVSTDFSVCCEETVTEQKPVAARSFPSASKSTDQPLPAGHVHVSDVPVASDEFLKVLSQVNVMQEAMSSLSTSSKMLSEKQLTMEKLVESLSDKYSKVEQEKLRVIERELEDIKEKHKNVVFQQDKRLNSFENKIKEHKKETERLKTQSKKFTKDLRDVLENVQKLNADMSVLEKKTASNTQMGALEGEIRSLKESLEELSRFEEHGSSLGEFIGRNEETLKVLTSAQESESEKLQKLEEKLSALENSWSEPTVENGKLCQDVETKYEMVCQILTDRLVPLERLRDIFNGKLDARAENIKKLDSICDQMADILPRISQFEKQTQRQAIGFSAQLSLTQNQFSSNDTLIFPDVTVNIGNNYDSKTGEFTASLDGLYAVYFSVEGYVEDLSMFGIIKKPCSCEKTLKECRCFRTYKELDMMHTNNLWLVEMKASDKLLVKCWINQDSLRLSGSTFSCFKIF